MPYIHHTTTNKLRILLSGFPNTGKTTSLQTFMYGQYDYYSANVAEHDLAEQTAADKHMVILTCPGEFGTRSLPQDTPHITCHTYESNTDINSTAWSREALSAFDDISTSVLAAKPDILVVDGLHSLWLQLMNRTTDGDYLAGVDLNLNPTTGRADPYRAAKYHSQTHNAFGQYVAGLYNSSIPLVVCTTWEEWDAGTTEGERPGDITTRRYLWPAIPGKMGKEVVGKFDARLSARVEKRCCHISCEDHKASREHYIWQFMPKNDVMGVGIKGCRRYNKHMLEYPYVHQNYADLQKLIKACS